MRAKLLFVFGILGLVLGMSGVSTSAVAQGNSEAAKQCQKGGWQELYRADQTPFANQGQCVSYRAQGGTFWTPPAVPTIEFQAYFVDSDGQGELGVSIWGTGLDNYSDFDSIKLEVEIAKGDIILESLVTYKDARVGGYLVTELYDSRFRCTGYEEVPDRLRVTISDVVSGLLIAETIIDLEPRCG